jgi:hypothetical protein
MRTTYITVLLKRKTCINNSSAHAHNFYYSSAHAQDFSVPKWRLYAKYRHILTPKSTNVEDYVSHTDDITKILLALPLMFSWPTSEL